MEIKVEILEIFEIQGVCICLVARIGGRVYKRYVFKKGILN